MYEDAFIAINDEAKTALYKQQFQNPLTPVN